MELLADHSADEPPPQPRLALPPARTRRRWLWPGVVGLLILAALAISLQIYRGHVTVATAGARAAPQVPVVASPAHKGDIGVYFTGLGTVTPLHTVTVKTRVDGQLMAVHYEEGQRVRQGDPLLDIDPRPFQVQLAQAEGPAHQRSGGAAERANGSAAVPDAHHPQRGRAAGAGHPAKHGRSGSGRREDRPGQHRQREIEHLVLPYHRVDHRPRRSAARRSRQHGFCRRRHTARRDRANPADQRDLHDPGTAGPDRRREGQGGAAPAGRRHGSRHGSGDRQRHADHARQPDRPDDRHAAAARDLSRIATRRCFPTSSSTRVCWCSRRKA